MRERGPHNITCKEDSMRAVGQRTFFKKLRLSPALVVAIVALAISLGGVAYATIPDSSGTIHGCYLDKIGTLRVIDQSSGQHCTSLETPIQWNQTGPAGPMGPQGTAGPQGPAGADGVSGYQIVSETVPYADPSSPVHQILTCPTGKKALSEGQNGGTALSDFPLADGSGWDWYEESGPATLYLICANAN
jgi:hypothetical protein